MRTQEWLSVTGLCILIGGTSVASAQVAVSAVDLDFSFSTIQPSQVGGSTIIAAGDGNYFVSGQSAALLAVRPIIPFARSDFDEIRGEEHRLCKTALACPQ